MRYGPRGIGAAIARGFGSPGGPSGAASRRPLPERGGPMRRDPHTTRDPKRSHRARARTLQLRALRRAKRSGLVVTAGVAR